MQVGIRALTMAIDKQTRQMTMSLSLIEQRLEKLYWYAKDDFRVQAQSSESLTRINALLLETNQELERLSKLPS